MGFDRQVIIEGVLGKIARRRQAVVDQRLASAQTGQPFEAVLETAMVDQQQVLRTRPQRALAALDKNLRVESELAQYLPDEQHRVGGAVPDTRAEADLVDADLP